MFLIIGLYVSLFCRDANKWECVCNGGYYGDGFVCTPEENCLNIPSLCDVHAQCQSTPKGLTCVCNSGKCFNYYRLSDQIIIHKFQIFSNSYLWVISFNFIKSKPKFKF